MREAGGRPVSEGREGREEARHGMVKGRAGRHRTLGMVAGCIRKVVAGKRRKRSKNVCVQKQKACKGVAK